MCEKNNYFLEYPVYTFLYTIYISCLDDYNDKVDEQIEALDKIKDKWSEIAENVTKAQNAMVANDYLGSGWKDKVLSGNDNDIYTVFKNQYEQNASQLKAYEDQIQSTERIYNLLNSYRKRI